MTHNISSIITPDQRLRVFVSSTLQELAEERTTAKKAIQNMQLIPVMFELGARPYAPKDLYREYLAQSQIFIGIYWEKYGWIAPEESISGLEDEYLLSAEMPKLIYIKNSDGKRETRLTDLLQKIENDDKVSYKTFANNAELEQLIINDLAVLLTEKFNLANDNQQKDKHTIHKLPASPNPLIGRKHCLKHLSEMLGDDEIRLITLSGPGGIGKTRLALETARMLQNYFLDGSAFVPLAPIRDIGLVPETIASVLGIKASNSNNMESIKLFLSDKKYLLILDNFEQIIPAASYVEDLLLSCPGLKIIVTSRERLSLSFEHVVSIPALKDHFETDDFQDENKLPAAIELFIKRATAIQPGFEYNEFNKDIIFQICHKLEGLPLAIELAAGQINLFSPLGLLQKLDHRLDVLKGSFRDIPDRQKTIRNTIEWSFELLTDAEQDFLLRVSLFQAGFHIHAAEMLGADLGEDVFALMESLMNKSLIFKMDQGEIVRFQMLESVRDFAMEKLQQQNRYTQLKFKQANYYLAALNEMKLQKDKIDQVYILAELEKEHSNIRSVMEFLLQENEIEKLTEISWNLWLFWWINAHTKEAYQWLKQAWEKGENQQTISNSKVYPKLICNVGIMAFLQRDFQTFGNSLQKHFEEIRNQDDDELVATAMLICGVVATILQHYDSAEDLLKVSLEKFKKIGLSTGINLALSGLGRNAVYMGGKTEEAKQYYVESLELARRNKDDINTIICLCGFALCEVLEKNAIAKDYLREALTMSREIHFYEALSWSVEIWALVSINENKFAHAVTLLSAVDGFRNRTHLPVWDDLEALIDRSKVQLRNGMGQNAFDSAWKAGNSMDMDAMIRFTLEDTSALSVAA
ncbi:MAG: DUF4062 domain-containing protein [Bacteroidetes bacterium]|nr:DUF4062 domain-containing protein [Bacteroidota bacterium]